MRPAILVFIFVVAMTLICPFCKTSGFQGRRGLAVHASSCKQAKLQLGVRITSRKKKSTQESPAQESRNQGERSNVHMPNELPVLTANPPFILDHDEGIVS